MSNENVEMVRRMYEKWNRSGGVPALELIDPGVEVDVVVTAHYFGRGRTSGVEVDMRHWHVWTLDDGKAVRWRILGTRAEALEAVGLSEQRHG